MTMIAPAPVMTSAYSPLMGSTVLGPTVMPSMMGSTVVSPMGTMAPISMGMGMSGMTPMGTIAPMGTMAPMGMGMGMGTIAPMGTVAPIASTGLMGSTVMPGVMGNTALMSNTDMGSMVPVPSQFMSGTPPVVAANLNVPGGTPSMINQLVGTRRIPIIKRQYFTKNWFSCLDMPGFPTECFPPRLI